MSSAPAQDLELAASIPVIGDAAYRNARLKLQRCLSALGVRDTDRALAVAEFSLLYRSLAVGDAIELSLVAQGQRLGLSLVCPAHNDLAERLARRLRLLRPEPAAGPDGTPSCLRLHGDLRCVHELHWEEAKKWLQGDTTEELTLRAAQTEEANAAKREFLSRMSHELRTPMNAIIGMTHLALRTDLDRRQRDYLEKIRSAGENLLGIINDILDFSKIEAGKLSLERTDFQLDKVLGDVTNMVAQ